MSHTEKAVRELLKKIAAANGYTNHELILNEIVSGGANYTSKLYTVILREQNKEDLHLFAKVATVGEQFRKEAPATLFTTEQFVYAELWKKYQALEEENGVPEEHRLQFTKFYGCDPTKYQETLVLQNLFAQGYGPFNRLKPYNWEYADSAIRDLAKLHALSLAYSEKHPQEFEKDLERLNFEWKEELTEFMRKNGEKLALETVKPEHKEALKRFIDKYMKDMFKVFYTPVVRPFIIHGDFRGDNLLHRVREDGKVDIKIVDLQTMQGGSPVADLLYFIFSGSDEQFRAQYYDQLIEHYYTQLSAAMKRLHLNPDELYSRKDFDLELKEKLPYGLAYAIFALPTITVEVENAPKLTEDLALSNMAVEKVSALYPERLNGVVSDFVKWGIVK